METNLEAITNGCDGELGISAITAWRTGDGCSGGLEVKS
jgi:hypothetical protein